MKIAGKKILITGGTAGIGLEAAKQFLEQGAKVIITGRDQQKLDLAKKKYPSLIAIKSDAGNYEDAFELYRLVEALGGIDILYNNAGILSSSLNLGIADKRHFEAAQQEMNVNYLGAVHLNSLFIEMLKTKKEAAIINTTSILSYVPSLVETTYSASKAALRFYTQTLREHLSILKSNVKVFELLPPVVATDMTSGRTGKKLTPEQLVNALINGLKKDHYTIRVGDTKALYFFSRFFPKLAFRLVNTKDTYKALQL